MPQLPRIIIDAKLFCPHCGVRHVDEARNGEKWHRRAHTTHRCQGCGGDFDVYVSGQADDQPPAVDIVERIASAARGIESEISVDSRAWVPMPGGTVTTLSDWIRKMGGKE